MIWFSIDRASAELASRPIWDWYATICSNISLRKTSTTIGSETNDSVLCKA